MKLPDDDAERLNICRCELTSAVIGDVLDSLGYTRQFLPPDIQPLRDDMVVCGRAMTVLDVDDDGGEGPGRSNEALHQPFGLMLRALDALEPNDVYIASGGSPRYALWGELMSQAAINRGAVGAVLNGYSRDTRGVLALGFATFSRGRYAQDQRPRGKVVDLRCRIRFGDAMIDTGDLVFGDLDGVCVIPREIEQEAIARALEKSRAEKTVMQAIQKGMGAQEAWDTYGVF
jgi:regulator of RNase E activity RraA